MPMSKEYYAAKIDAAIRKANEKSPGLLSRTDFIEAIKKLERAYADEILRAELNGLGLEELLVMREAAQFSLFADQRRGLPASQSSTADVVAPKRPRKKKA
jgi:hypothetical protein